MDFEQLYNNFYIKYAIVSVLLLILYKYGFERPLPLLKKIIVYVALIVGAFPLVLFAYFGLPIVPGLIVAILLFIGVRLRERSYPKAEEKGSDTNGAK